ncbi:MAG TPA: histidine kinase N-terminal 7TM domain-containing protein [Vicinamibacterales bacterium]|nr:histidine kinase N-terminal 7TM domain-containing protein [Vicinamibacterales bacterium]
MLSPIGLTVAYSVSALISLGASMAIINRREVRGGRALGLMLLAAALWAACDAIEVHLPTVEGRRLISQIQYFGVVSCSPFFFHAAMELARLEGLLTRPMLVAVWGIPVISLAMAWTSNYHQMLWTSIELPKPGGVFSTYNYGWWFWVLAVQHYVLTLVSTLVLLSARRRVTRAFRAPMLAVVIAVAISWIGNCLYIFKLGPWPGLNYLTMSLGLSGAVLAWAVVSEGLLDLLPRAREALIDTIADGVVILDRADRVIYANAAAQEHLGMSADAVQVPATVRIPERNRSSAPWLGEMAVPSGNSTRWIDVRVDPVADRWGDVAGRLVVTRDITVRKVLEEERERLIGELKRALQEVHTLEDLLPICASCKKVRDDKGYWSQIDVYLRNRAAVEFTHGICPDCDARLYGQLKEQTE